MPALRTYKIFICHAWKRRDDYYRVELFLDTARNFSWQNLSVPYHAPLQSDDQLEYNLRNQMRDADVFIVLAGMYVAYSDWIDFEIGFARRIGRRILGIQPWGSTMTPVAVQKAADEIVGWRQDSIVSAIRRLAPR